MNMSNKIEVDEGALAIRVSNALTLAQALGKDMTEPMDAAYVLRHLRSVESYVKNEVIRNAADD